MDMKICNMMQYHIHIHDSSGYGLSSLLLLLALYYTCRNSNCKHTNMSSNKIKLIINNTCCKVSDSRCLCSICALEN